MLWPLACWSLAACAPFVVAPGPEAHHPTLSADTYTASDGTKLPLRTWEPVGDPAGEPAAVVLGLHGFGDYRAAFEGVGEALAAAGIRLVAYDQRGFGEAPGRGYWHGSGRMIEDAADAVAWLGHTYPDQPIYILGLSMGGAVAMNVAAEHPDLRLRGLAMVAPAVWGRQTMPAIQRGLLWAAARSAPWFPLTGQGLQIQPTDNLALLLRMARDPHILRKFRVDTVWGLTNLMDRALRNAEHIHRPSLFQYGLRDEIVPLHPTRVALLSMPPANRRVAVYPQGFHMLLRDIHGAAAVQDLIAWIKAPDAPLPSGADSKGLERLADFSSQQ